MDEMECRASRLVMDVLEEILQCYMSESEPHTTAEQPMFQSYKSFPAILLLC